MIQCKIDHQHSPIWEKVQEDVLSIGHSKMCSYPTVAMGIEEEKLACYLHPQAMLGIYPSHLISYTSVISSQQPVIYINIGKIGRYHDRTPDDSSCAAARFRSISAFLAMNDSPSDPAVKDPLLAGRLYEEPYTSFTTALCSARS